jgi:hypothetical protein
MLARCGWALNKVNDPAMEESIASQTKNQYALHHLTFTHAANIGRIPPHSAEPWGEAA